MDLDNQSFDHYSYEYAYVWGLRKILAQDQQLVANSYGQCLYTCKNMLEALNRIKFIVLVSYKGTDVDILISNMFEFYMYT